MILKTKEETKQRVKKLKGKVSFAIGMNPGATILKGRKGQIINVVDVSGSATPHYNSGAIQYGVEQVMAFALQFDDDGEIPVIPFDTGVHEGLPDITIDNIHGYVDRHIKKLVRGGTKYAPAMEHVVNLLEPSFLKKGLGKIFKNHAPKLSRDFKEVFFWTDGDCWDAKNAEKIIRATERLPIFWQFIGFGDNEKKLKFLRKLDTMDRRFQDNANFFHIRDINASNPMSTYNLILDELPSWIEDMVAKKIILP